MLTRSIFTLNYEDTGVPKCMDCGAYYYPRDPVHAHLSLWFYVEPDTCMEEKEVYRENRLEDCRCDAKELLKAMETLGPVDALTAVEFAIGWVDHDYPERKQRFHMSLWDAGDMYGIDFGNDPEDIQNHFHVTKEAFARFMRGARRMLVAAISYDERGSVQVADSVPAQSVLSNSSDTPRTPRDIGYRNEYEDNITGKSYALSIHLNPGTHTCSLKIIEEEAGKSISCQWGAQALTCDAQELLDKLKGVDKVSALERLDWRLEESGEVVSMRASVQDEAVEVQFEASGTTTRLGFVGKSELTSFLEGAYEMLKQER